MRHTHTLKFMSALMLSLSLAACGGGQSGSPAASPVSTMAAPGSDAGSSTATTAGGGAARNSIYPNYNTNPLKADATGMANSATTLSTLMGAGWNIGNTLEAIGGETAWGNPQITPELIAAAKQMGFKTIRLPVSWDQYANQSTAKISDAWMARVKAVVKMCVDNGMYVIVNIHWDGGWLENNLTVAKQTAVGAKQKAYWQQIATNLREFDEHLLFASANEPDAGDQTATNVLMAHHQTFVDAVRSTGGRNAYRSLIVQGPRTNIDLTNTLMTTLPRDTAAGRMMAEVHFYPFQYSLMTEPATWGVPFYYWGAAYHSTTDTAHNPTWGEEAYIDQQFGLMKTQFVDKGVPVVIGEYGAVRRESLTGDDLTLHLKGRAYFYNYVNRKARANGMIPVYWDAGGGGGNNTMTLIDRRTLAIYDQQVLDAVMAGIQGGTGGL